MGGFISDIFGGGKDNPDTVTHVNRNVPEWQEKAGEELYGKVKDTMNKPAEARIYPWTRLAEPSNGERAGIRESYATRGAYAPEMSHAGGLMQEQYRRAPERVTTGRFTDPNSAFEEYVNKIYSPMEKRLHHTADRAVGREQLANAYAGRGKSSMGLQRLDALDQQRQDQLAALQAQALNQANQFFQSDEARMLQAAQGNQTAALQDKQLNLKAAEGLANTVLSKYNMNAQDIQRLMAAGMHERSLSQQELDNIREKWNEMNNFDRMELEWAFKMLNQNPGGTTTSTTSAPGANPALQFAGAALPLITNFMK